MVRLCSKSRVYNTLFIGENEASELHVYIAKEMNVPKQKATYFTEQLLHWHKHDNDRILPWKEEQDPYKIWLSEIILQQTRVEQGMPYYLRFVAAYPTIQDMAEADDDEVFKLWQGLGYYNRCKNMLGTARYISNELKGVFPSSYEDILSLKGVGAYTAAAISSFAYGLPQAVVDGNVYRVLSRYWGIDTPIDSTEGKKQFAALAAQLLSKKESASYNQAIMDYGSMVCKPKAPLCDECLFAKKCTALKQELVTLLPVKAKSMKVRNRYFHYVVLEYHDKIWVRKRGEGDIWQNLYEPLLFEGSLVLDKKSTTQLLRKEKLTFDVLNYEGEYKQRLTHQAIHFQFYTCKLKEQHDIENSNGKWVFKQDIKSLSFPKTVVSFFEKKLYF